MNTLIIYASKHGCAKRCSEMLSKKLTGKVEMCNLKDKSAPELSGYDKVIIGGSIYAGRIQKEVSDFCMKNLNVLKGKKVGLFICCMNKNAAAAQLKSSFPKELQDLAAASECFGGEFKFSEFNFFEKTITKMVSKSLAKEGASLPSIDMKKDMDMISEDIINKFSQRINAA